MQFINDVRQKAGVLIAENASTLLTAGGVVGTVTTAVLAGRGGYKFAEVLRNEQKDRLMEIGALAGEPEEITLEFKTKAKLAAIWFGPPTLTCTATVVSIVMANRMSAQKAAALAAAYGLAERNLSEYKEKVAEKLTGPKKASIDEELAQDAVNKTEGHDRVVFVEGYVLCFDKPTGRYFNSTVETVKKAVNTTNAEIYNHGFARASFFYSELGLEDTMWTDEVGFNAENLCDVSVDAVVAPDGRPCIVFDFLRYPKAEFDPKMY